MDSERFFALIDDARAGAGPTAPVADAGALSSVLDALSDAELSGFVRQFEVELVRLNRWDLWGAGYVAAGGMSDDAFHYFRCWLLGKGADAVEIALRDPDALAPFLDGELDGEELEYVGLDLLEARGLDDPRDHSADGEPTGSPFDEEAVEDGYPRIAAR